MTSLIINPMAPQQHRSTGVKFYGCTLKNMAPHCWVKQSGKNFIFVTSQINAIKAKTIKNKYHVT